MPSPLKHRNRKARGGQVLLGLLAVVVIVIVLMMTYLGPHEDKNGALQPSIEKQALDSAQGVAIDNNLSQIRQYISMYRGDHDGKAPASYDELKSGSHFPDSMFVNPLDNKPYDYDPDTGRIWVAGGSPHGHARGAGYAAASSDVASGDNPDAGAGAAPTSAAGANSETGGITIPNIPSMP